MIRSSTIKNLAGKTALVTGSTDGIGKHTAFLLAKSGAKVLIHGRDSTKLSETKSSILKKIPNADIDSYCYNFNNIDSIKEFCNEISNNYTNLDILINNAGIFTSNYNLINYNNNNIESTFLINVLSTYILLCKLLPLLRATNESRILNISSISQSDLGSIDLNNLQFQNGNFNNYNSYSLSKLCVAALSYELSLRITHKDSLVMSCDPGTVNTKMLLAGWGRCGIDVDNANHEYNLVTVPLDFDSDEVTGSSVYRSGSYSEGEVERLMKLKTAVSAHGQYFVGGRISRCCPDVYNDEIRRALWDECERLTGVTLQL